jgi:hypothetical protein
LQRHLWRADPDYLDRDYVLTGCFQGEMVPAYLPPSFTRGSDADFAVDFTRADCHLRHADRPEVLRVERQGVGLVLVRDLRGDPP